MKCRQWIASRPLRAVEFARAIERGAQVLALAAVVTALGALWVHYWIDVPLARAQSVVQDGQSFRGVLQQQSMGGVVRADTTAKMLTMDADGNLLIKDAGAAGALSGATFTQNNALGPSSFREDNLQPNSTIHKDSSVVMSTLGATRIGLFFYVVPDTGGALGDSLNTATHWYALGLRANVTAANDTGSAAQWLPVSPQEAVAVEGGSILPRAIARSLQDTIAVIAQNTALYPGEILVALHCARNGQSGWRYIEINHELFPGGFVPDRFSFTLRSMGHSYGGSALIHRNGFYRTRVRVDARGYR